MWKICTVLAKLELLSSEQESSTMKNVAYGDLEIHADLSVKILQDCILSAGV